MRPALLLALVLLTTTALGCGEDEPAPEYVVRVGDELLTTDELNEALRYIPTGGDTSEARQQVIEQWVRNALLYQEAERLGLQRDSVVRQQMREAERSVLISALIERLREEVQAPTAIEMATYFDQNRESLRLREPFVRVRYLASDTAEAAAAARQALLDGVRAGTADSLWAGIARQYASDVDEALQFADTYFPERQVREMLPTTAGVLGRLEPGNVAPITQAGDRYYLIQLVDRLPAGTLPEMEWVEDEVRRRLLMQRRKQTIQRQVQRLRNEASARDALDIR